MKLMLGLFVLTLSFVAQAAPATYTCQVTAVASEAVPGQLFSDNVRGKAVDCSPVDLIGNNILFFSAPGAARTDLENSLRDGTKIALTTSEPVAYGGTIIAVNGRNVGELGATENALLEVYASTKSRSVLRAEVERVLDLHKVPRVARVDHSHGKELKTWSRRLQVQIAADLTLRFEDEGPSLSYGAIHPPSSEIRVEYVKSARGNVGRILTAGESSKLAALLGTSLPYKVDGKNLSSDKPSTARFTKTADGHVRIELREAR